MTLLLLLEQNLADWKKNSNFANKVIVMANKHPQGYWSIERVTDEAHKYVSRNQFRENAYGAFKAAEKYGLLDILFTPSNKVVHVAGYWTDERVIEEGKNIKPKETLKAILHQLTRLLVKKG